jgi:hypothetical protein
MPASNTKIGFPIIDVLGGDEAVLDILEKKGRSGNKSRRLTLHAIRWWKSRRAIPNSVKWILAQECEDRNISFSPSDFEAVSPKEMAS